MALSQVPSVATLSPVAGLSPSHHPSQLAFLPLSSRDDSPCSFHTPFTYSQIPFFRALILLAPVHWLVKYFIKSCVSVQSESSLRTNNTNTLAPQPKLTQNRSAIHCNQPKLVILVHYFNQDSNQVEWTRVGLSKGYSEKLVIGFGLVSGDLKKAEWKVIFS